MNEWLLHNGNRLPTGLDRTMVSLFPLPRFTLIAIYRPLVNDGPIANTPGAPQCEDTPDEEPTVAQQSDLTYTPDPTNAKPHAKGVGVENVEGKVYGQPTGLYKKHQKYSEIWNPSHLLKSRTSLWEGWIIQPTNTNIDHSTSEVGTGPLKHQLIPI